MKKCTKCLREKEEKYFPKEKARKDGHYPWCKNCLSSHRKNRYTKRPRKVILTHKVCSLCKLDKPRDQYRLYKGKNLHYRCRDCEDKIKAIKDAGLKVCGGCGRAKKLDKFYPSRRDKYRANCIKCEARYSKQKGRWHYIQKKYGLSQDEWFEIYNRYDGRCYICQRKMSVGGGLKGVRASTDHCHLTGARRLIICNHCNADVLPEFEYDIDRAKRLLTYLTTDWQNGYVPEHTQKIDKENLSKRNKL